MGAMPRPLPPHLNHEKSRHGKRVWKVRVGKGPRIVLAVQEYDTEPFWACYRDALAGDQAQPADVEDKKPRKNSLSWLIAQYRDSGAWQNGLSPATRRQRENIFKQVRKTGGRDPAAEVTTKDVKAGVERRSKTPSQARHFLDAMRGLFEWAVAAEHVETDPTVGVVPPARPKTEGFKAWSEADVALYYARWPLGTKERVWIDVLRYMGYRRGDAVTIGRQHLRPIKYPPGIQMTPEMPKMVAILRTEKSGKMVTATIPVMPALQATLDAGPTGELAFICGARGGPLTKESFGNAFSEAARKAGVKKSAHGVRKISATTAANHGATEAELEAMYGWVRGSKISAKYTQEADRERLGLMGGLKVAAGTQNEQISPTPEGQPPTPEKNLSRPNGLRRLK